jgi:hypothetical protein
VSVTELSTLIASITALLAGVGLPLYATYRKGRGVTASGVMQLLVQERDRVQKRLDDVEVHHAQAMAAAEAEWRKLHEKDQAQIAQLHDEIDSLYRRLYQPPQVGGDPLTR